MIMTDILSVFHYQNTGRHMDYSGHTMRSYELIYKFSGSNTTRFCGKCFDNTGDTIMFLPKVQGPYRYTVDIHEFGEGIDILMDAARGMPDEARAYRAHDNPRLDVYKRQVRYFSAIGMSEYVDQRKLDAFVRKILQEQSNPILRYRKPGTDIVYVEVKKYIGDFAIILRGQKEADGKVNMSVILPAVQERAYSVLLDWEIERDEDSLMAFLIGEEEETGAQLEISVLDLVECLTEKPGDSGDSVIAAFYALSTEGKVLLNVERSQEDEEAYRSEEEWRRQMLKRAREGDEEAMDELKADSLAMEEDILERMRCV